MERTKKLMFWGTSFIVVGGLLLAKNLDLITGIPDYIMDWPSILILVGIYVTFIKERWGGLFPLGIGLYFLLQNIFEVTFVPLYQLWPLALVIVGVGMLIRIGKEPSKKKDFSRRKVSFNIDDNYMEATAIFGGENRQVSSYDFKGGKITVIFGGMELDLTNCTLSKDQPEIEVQAVFGGLSLTVPKEWNVKSEIKPIIGGVSDDINQYKGAYIDPAAVLILRGTTIMGGIEIKRA